MFASHTPIRDGGTKRKRDTDDEVDQSSTSPETPSHKLVVIANSWFTGKQKYRTEKRDIEIR